MIFYSKMQGDPKNRKIVPKSAPRAHFCARVNPKSDKIIPSEISSCPLIPNFVVLGQF